MNPCSRRRVFFAFASLVAASLSAIHCEGHAAPVVPQSNPQGAPNPPYPILFVTQVPIPGDFTSIGSVFGNHRGDVTSCGRGGDLWIRYPDGSLKNLTANAGFGTTGFQGANSIAVRDPCVDWSGTKALFSMVVGATTQQYQYKTYYWQMYEIAGLGPSDTPVITKVANQPTNANNVSPIYGSDGRILFTSDRPRNGASHLYPQLDEYEEAPTVSGIWSLDPLVGDLRMLTHAPSGDFTPLVDSFGRVLFTQWDHLQRDQQADGDLVGAGYGTFDWSDESASSVPLAFKTEIFPEPRPNSPAFPTNSNLVGHTFNHFFPWQVNQDGTELETINHIGRHELHSYFAKSIKFDSNVKDFVSVASGTFNPNRIQNALQITEDPNQPGRYVAVDAPEFTTHAAGQLIEFTLPPGANPDQVAVGYITHPETHSAASNPSPNHSGLYRDPVVLSDGTLAAIHTAETEIDANLGTTANPLSKYDFRLKTIVSGGAYSVGGTLLTNGITKTVSWWSPDVLVSYSGTLWELTPVEVRPRPVPPMPSASLPTLEAQAFAQAGVDAAQFRAWLWRNGLAAIISRDVTTRDQNDEQQPYNLRVAGTSKQTIGSGGTVYDIAHQQIFQADQVRSLGGAQSPKAGRRVLARTLHDPAATNPPNPTGPEGSVSIASDGSVAAFVPARRALSWQLTDVQGIGVVRERYWLNFQPGEIRTCTSCHGLNTLDQAGHATPQNAPLAFTNLLEHYQSLPKNPNNPTLGNAAHGTTGSGAGGPFDVLTINGSAGGTAHRVDVATGTPITITLTPPASHPGNAKFALYVLVGAPSPSIEFNTFLGPMVFPPTYFAPQSSGVYTLGNSFGPDPTAIAPATAAPWSFVLPAWLPAGTTFTFQGVIEDDTSSSSPLGITNAVIVQVH